MPNKDDFEGGDNVYYVGSEPAQFGLYQGYLVNDYLKAHKDYDKNKNGKLDLVILKGAANHQDTMLRTTNVLFSLMSNSVPVNKVATIDGNWSFNKAFDEVKNVLTKNGPENVEMIIANNDEMALGAISALKQFGYNDGSAHYIPVFGIDATKAGLDALRKGELEGTVKNDSRAMSKVILHLLKTKTTDDKELAKEIGYEYENGIIYVPYEIVTK